MLEGKAKTMPEDQAESTSEGTLKTMTGARVKTIPEAKIHD